MAKPNEGYNDWLRKAISDLKSAKKLAKDDEETLDAAAYHTQQCVEKVLKAVLVFYNRIPPRTHDLEKILTQCAEFDSSLKALTADVVTLTPYASYSRYPDSRFKIGRSDVEEAITIAQKVFKLIDAKINTKPDPNLTIFK